MRLIQISGPTGRLVALVEESRLRLLQGPSSIFELAQHCLANGVKLADFASSLPSTDSLSYDEVYNGQSAWKVLPSADHPSEPSRCLVSGTGLTHMASAKNRQAMHGNQQEVNDSIRMYEFGVAAGRPEPGSIGNAPEWFYKGPGTILRGHNDFLIVPPYSEDGGEEPEIAGVYLIDQDGAPRRIGLTVGNEFSDHVFEKKNYLNLAGSKLRTCAIGPELVLEADFGEAPGEVRVERGGKALWSKAICSGENVMCHSLANLEHHHFKFEAHRRPGDLHVHFFGADAFSFGDGLQLVDGDVMQVHFQNFGRPLRNVLQRMPVSTAPVVVRPL